MLAEADWPIAFRVTGIFNDGRRAAQVHPADVFHEAFLQIYKQQKPVNSYFISDYPYMFRTAPLRTAILHTDIRAGTARFWKHV